MSQPAETMEPSSVSVTGAVVLAAAFVGLTAMAGAMTMAMALALLMTVVAWGWAGALGLPTPRGTVGVLLLGGLAILLSIWLPTGAAHMDWLPGAMAVSIITAFLHQLLRRDGRPRVAESVSAVLLALAVFASSAFFVPLSRSEQGSLLVLGAVAAAAAAALVEVITRGRGSAVRPWVVPAAMTAGGAVAVVVALLSQASWAALLLIGVFAAVVSHAVRSVFAILPTMVHARPRVVVASSSVLVVGIVPYLVAVLLVPSALPL